MPASVEGPVGLSFGRVADEYERARPEYPAEAVDRAVAELALTAESTVLDLAAGTGKLTRALQARTAHVIAVEPDEGMRAKIDGDVRAGRAESIPVDDDAVDAVFVADAFHWFDASSAIAEIRRVLRPAGGIALLWNHWPIPEDVPDAKAALDRVWRRFHGDRTTFESTWEQELEAAFGPLAHARYERELRYSADLYADLCVTGSCPAALPDAERDVVRRELRSHLPDENVLAVPTDVYWVRT